MDDPVLLFGIASLSCCVFSLSSILVLYKSKKKHASTGERAPLPPPELVKGKSPWNISRIDNPENVSVSNGEFIVKIRKGVHGSESGGSFRANPNKKLPSETVTLSYEVYFPTTLQWIKGGKLPGVCFGVSALDCSTGGNWGADSGSFRVMFRENGLAIGYTYLAIKGGAQAAIDAQGPTYKDVVVATGGTGHDLWKKKNAGLKFSKGAWNTVTMELRLNSIGKRDGLIKLTVNGETRTIADAVFRQNSKVKFTNVNIVSFFGGGSSEWDSPIDTMIKFRNFRFDAS